MPVIKIAQSNDRTTEQKAEVTKRITEAMVDVYGVRSESVMVFFEEYDDESWGKNGLLNFDRKKAK